ncbi:MULTISPECIES: endo-beta-N-acetylglucosaminidase H [unclassified Amycolatopsis]|uniref:endo-beta-N-acetylglucosaminidase H n=1 Tax=unclassified Amycolatopsis TaxID=2618356 RepID=UPI0028770A3F|nr:MULTISPECIES: endo-beta-N-acetylglucosaminidase H [unclassified Amycolatopsis]MDS0135929.1 chitinase [Amycolatopsis sp. 505]MDS0145482.1 chitinase [Amycolatopsis sp. CM201R]
MVKLGRITALLAGAALLAAMTTGTSAASTSAASRKSGPITVAYVEVNNNSMLNVGKYALAQDGGNVFDIGVIFAANINYDTATKSAYLYFNPNVQRVLDNVSTQVRPLQAKGIKVMLSILGNHQGAGFANFPSQQAAAAFAKQLSDAVAKYGLDGIDFDDEYAEYGNNGTGQPNASSFVHLVTALRAAMPTKLISLYNIGPAASRLSYGGTDITSKFNYAWNPYYGTWGVPNIALPKSGLSPAAVQIAATSTSTAASLAQRTVNEGYGVYLTYNLGAADSHTYISSFTKPLYGKDAVYRP